MRFGLPWPPAYAGEFRGAGTIRCGGEEVEGEEVEGEAVEGDESTSSELLLLR